jgi:cytoskeleton protein RodZ
MDRPVESATVGFLLKEGRQEAGLSIKEVAERTCIRRTYLEALEADRFDLLPGEVYVHGFVRNFAEAIGLEAAPLLAQIRLQKPPVMADEHGPVAAQKRRSGVLGWALLALLIVAVAGGLLYGEWRAGASGQQVPAVSATEQAPLVVQDGTGAVPASQPTAVPTSEPAAPLASEPAAVAPPHSIPALGR